MRTNYERNKFIEILRDTPFIYLASKKAGIAPATVYRWKKTVPEFSEAMDKAIELGRRSLNDMAESILVKKMKEGSLPAVRFYLEHCHERYIPKRSVYLPPLPRPHNPLHPGELCEYCGTEKAKPNSFEEERKWHEMFTHQEYTREHYQNYLSSFYKGTRTDRKRKKHTKQRPADESDSQPQSVYEKP